MDILVNKKGQKESCRIVMMEDTFFAKRPVVQNPNMGGFRPQQGIFQNHASSNCKAPIWYYVNPDRLYRLFSVLYFYIFCVNLHV